MEGRGYYEDNRNMEESKVIYTLKQKWLLFFTLALGAVFAWYMLNWGIFEALKSFSLRYAAFWGVYLLAFYFAAWKKAKGRMEAWALLAFAVFLFVRYWIYEAQMLSVINLLAIPMLLMLHAVISTADIPKNNDLALIKLWILGWVYKPFVGMGNWFGAIGSAFGGKKGNKNILPGVLCAIPLVIIVMALLVSADSVMRYYMEHVIENIIDIAWRIVAALVIAVTFYSFIFSMAYKSDAIIEEPVHKKLEPVSAMVVLGFLIVVYALFTYLQFAYLTGARGLPAELTYSQYATRGFQELVVVAAINFTVFFVIVNFTKEHRWLKPFLAALLVATGVILYSGIARLSMYIDAYGLTVQRILPMWLMIFLVAVLILAFVKLFVPKLRFLRIALSVFIVWYVALNAVNLDAMVASSIIGRAQARGELSNTDAYYLRFQISDDAKGVIENSPFTEQIRAIKVTDY